MRLAIDHCTRYDYSVPLSYAFQSLRLTPPSNAHQTVIDWRITAPGALFEQRDEFGNLAHNWSMARRTCTHMVRAEGAVDTCASAWLDADDAVPPWLYLRSTPLTASDARLQSVARECLGDAPDEAGAVALAERVRALLVYRPGTTGVHTTAQEALSLGAGVCQDQAHVFLAACRSHGVPARYVSGYFYAPHAARMASHAWVDVALGAPLPRWYSIDITHACPMDERHVRLAVGLDYAACAPVRGIREGGGDESMRISIEIRDTSLSRSHSPACLEP